MEPISDENKVSEVKPEKKERERSLNILLALLFISILIPIGVKFYNMYLEKKLEYIEKAGEEKRLRQEVSKLEKESEKLKKTRENLKSKSGVEKVARNKLGMTKPKEIPFVVNEPAKPSPSPEEVLKDKKEKKSDKEE